MKPATPSVSPIGPVPWWGATKNEAHAPMFTAVRQIDRLQFDVFNRFKQLEALYDTAVRPGQRVHRTPRGYGRMHENVVASNIDTVSAQVAITDVRAVFDTDDGDWGTQRRAKRLEWYAEGIGKLMRLPAKCRHAEKTGAAMKGTAAMKVWRDRFDRPRAEPVMVDDLVVDELETRFFNGEPRTLYHRYAIDRDELAQQYPEFAAKIRTSQGGFGSWQTWAGWRPIQRNEVVVIEGWRLPLGTKGHVRYKAGRHLLAIDGCTLVDEDWDEEFFPFAIHRWTKPIFGWYGIGMAERIAGVQLALNRANLQLERKADHGAYPTTWFSQADAGLAQQHATVIQNTYGTTGVYRGSQPPVTVTPAPFSPEEMQQAERLSSKASQISGVSRMASQSMKPAGIETGVALREYRDQTTQRFAEQEKDFEQFVLDTIWLVLWVCKGLGDKAPKIIRANRFGTRTITWSEVDMAETRVWMSAAATLSRTRAGREQTVVEWAQAGIVSQDDARRLMEHPDLERAMSLYTAAIENCDEVLEEIAEGTAVMPEPYMNLKLLVWRAQQQYLNWWKFAPESVLENLRTLIVQAAYWAGGGQQQPVNGNVGPDMSMAQPGAAPVGGPGAPPPPPPFAPGPPMVAPQAAFSPQAMSLMPSGAAGAG